MNGQNATDRALRGVGALSSFLAVISLTLLVILFGAIIVLRLFGIIVPSADEFASIALAGTFVLGLAYAVARDEHIEIRLAVDLMPRRIQTLLGFLAIVLSMFMVLVLCWGVGRLWWEAFQRGTSMLGTLPIPRAVPLGVVLAGLILFEVALLLKLLRFISGNRTPDQKLPAEHQNG